MNEADRSAAPSDEQLADALLGANIPTLLLVLVHLTGDQKWLEDPYRPVRGPALDDNDAAGHGEDIQEAIRSAAVTAIGAWRDGDLDPVDLDDDKLAEMLSRVLGEDVPAPYGPILAEEMGLTSRFVDFVAPEDEPKINAIVIGAGVSGICAAVHLERANIPYEVLELSEDVGGTWFENRYPGCGVDTPVHLYSFSFAQKPDWTRYYAKQGEVFDYIDEVVEKFDLRSKMSFGTEVISAIYDESEALWMLSAVNAAGETVEYEASVLITAAGMITRPSVPDIPGIDQFEGPLMHTARWDDSIDLAGKRIGVLGTGATAMQLVPAVVDTVAHTTVFQRSPQWALPNPTYKRDVSERQRLLMQTVPFYAGWYRLRAFWNFGDRLQPQLKVDPEWVGNDLAINPKNERHREFLSGYIREHLSDRADLIEACLPDYPPYGKRPLIDNGWFETIKRDDVSLLTGSVSEVTSTGVITDGGEEVELDILILATGFKTLEFLGSLEVRGRSGRTLRETWGEEDARAYLGITMPDFPNLFFLNGPNTNPGHGGSSILASEMQMRYAMDVIAYLIENGCRSAECSRKAFDEYNEVLDEALAMTIWTHPGMSTYYRNSRGRIVTNSPWSYLEYWNLTRSMKPEDFEFERVSANVG